jgi:hypothetical protein
MSSIIIYTTPEKLLHKQGKLKNDPDHSDTGEYYWEFGTQPLRANPGNRVYFATEGLIRGYFIIRRMIYHGIEFSCYTWEDITPVPQKSFQGFKYADKMGLE